MGVTHLPKISLPSLCDMKPLTPFTGGFMAEAATVSLESQGHVSGVAMNVSGTYKEIFEIEWTPGTEDMRRSHADPKVAAEWGAYGIACILIRELTPHKVIEKSYSPSGFDFWLGDKEVFPFQNKARMEVSGIVSGSESQIRTRVKEKLEQTNPSDGTGLPAYVIVVEFSNPQAKVVEK